MASVMAQFLYIIKAFGLIPGSSTMVGVAPKHHQNDPQAQKKLLSESIEIGLAFRHVSVERVFNCCFSWAAGTSEICLGNGAGLTLSSLTAHTGVTLSTNVSLLLGTEQKEESTDSPLMCSK